MLRLLCLTMFVHAALCGAVRADHFTIDLQAEAAGQSRTAHADTQGPRAKAKTRPILHLKAGDRVSVKWTVTNSDLKDTFKDVLVHFFVVKEDQAGQEAIPKLGKGVVVESALTMDFRSGDKTRGELTFAIDAPGAYLLRLETLGAAVEQNVHEHYAALDVVAK